MTREKAYSLACWMLTGGLIGLGFGYWTQELVRQRQRDNAGLEERLRREIPGLVDWRILERNKDDEYDKVADAARVRPDDKRLLILVVEEPPRSR